MLSRRIINSLVGNGVINSEDKDLYMYGLHEGLLMGLNIIITIIIGLFFGMALESIVFMMSYIPVRIYAGGYHSKTQLRCFIFSINMIILVLLAIKFINIAIKSYGLGMTLINLGIVSIDWTGFLFSIFEITSALIIFKFAPVEDSNKPLEKIEVAVYKKRTRLILLIQVCLIFILSFFKFNKLSLCILTSHIALSIMLILGKIKNKKIKPKLNESQIDGLS